MGFWKLNDSLLCEKRYVDGIKSLIKTNEHIAQRETNKFVWSYKTCKVQHCTLRKLGIGRNESSRFRFYDKVLLGFHDNDKDRIGVI